MWVEHLFKRSKYYIRQLKIIIFINCYNTLNGSHYTQIITQTIIPFLLFTTQTHGTWSRAVHVHFILRFQKLDNIESLIVSPFKFISTKQFYEVFHLHSKCNPFTFIFPLHHGYFLNWYLENEICLANDTFLHKKEICFLSV